MKLFYKSGDFAKAVAGRRKRQRYIQQPTSEFLSKWLLPMKLTALLLTVTFLQVSGKALSQKITYSGENVSLEKIFTVIKQQTGYVFFYRNKDISLAKPVTVHLEDASLHSALEVVFQEQPLSFSIEGNTIVVSQKIQNDDIGNRFAYLPPPVHGKVTDAKGHAIAGASVRIKGSNKGTITDENGRFSIEVPNNSILVVSSIGFESKEVDIHRENDFHIVLKASKSQLDQLVVVAYGTQNKASYTGSLVTLSPETFQDAPHENVLQSLQGNVPGVQVSNGSGEPGSSGDILMRGIGSINASRGPLYVVDGIPSTVSVSGLNPDDILSLTVLKDAAATSIYGSRAANGVIIITTKQGKSGKTKLSFSVMQGVNKLTIRKKDWPLNTDQMMELEREGWVNAGKNIDDFIPHVLSEDIDTTINTNWVKALTRLGNFSQYHLSAAGGSEHTQFYISGSYLQSMAAQRGDDYKRGNVMLSITNQATKRLSITGKLLGYYDLSHAVPTAGSLESPIRAFFRVQPWIPIYNKDGSYNIDFNGSHNIVGEMELNHRPHAGFHGTAQGGMKYEITRGLTFESNESVSLAFDKDDVYYNPDFGSGRHTQGEGSSSASYTKAWTTTNILRYKHTFNSLHTMEVFAGYEAQQSFSSGVSAEAAYFLPGLETLNAASLPEDASSSNSSNALAGAFINANYNYNDRYFLSASFRRDGSSRFGSDRRYGNFWSAGAGWNLHRTILQEVHFITDLKLRASYGTSGNQGISNTAARGLYSSGHDYNGQSGYLFSQYENPILTWELNKPLDIGLDFSLFNNRLSGSVDYYDRVTSQLLLDVPLPATNGVTDYSDNYGSMKNTGWEAILSSRNIINPDRNGFTWTTNFNISTNKNRITSLPSPLTSSTYKREVGYDYYSFYLPAYAGVDPQTGEALWYSAEDKSSTTNDFNQSIRLLEGSALPKFYGGLTNAFSFKHFSLSFMFYYKWGSKVYDVWGHDTNSDGTKGFDDMGKMSHYIYDHRWQKPGDKTDVPKVVYHGTQNSNAQSTRFLYDGSYIRLRDVELSYTLPSHLTHALKIDNARIYFRANNLYTFVKDQALTIDPEVYADGELDQYAPIYKTITMGVNIDF